MSNRLSGESSPYLLQHAHNPVDWFPWGAEALSLAQKLNKPVLVSIGYSACHWCHVMERESFENEEIAQIMNEGFVSIKVDREERPDIDNIYMDAVQVMGVRGGWPLNVFILPDGKPFYGVTYLPPKNWIKLLSSIQNAFQNHYSELSDSADGFLQSLSVSEVEKFNLQNNDFNFNIDALEKMYLKLKENFDTIDGGMNRAPKFPMPSIYKFLLRYYDLTLDSSALKQLELTLDRMALGGIYDHVGGGWARYSVDGQWFIPHFEKMLYDNGQLLSIYSEAFQLTQKPLYAHRIRQTYEWLKRELQSPEGGFYAALDADSEGIEGKFYTWDQNELKVILNEDFNWFSEIYQTKNEGNWEETNHLHLEAEHNLWNDPITIEAYNRVIEKLLSARSHQIRPGLDDKILTGWNGLLLKGLCDAYRALGIEEIRETATSIGAFISENVLSDHKLFRSFKNGKATVSGFLEDYAAVIQGFIGLYQITFDEQWLTKANSLTETTLANFYDPHEGFFYFTSDDSPEARLLITRKKELFDNVIPASNSIMAHNLHELGLLLDKTDYTNLSNQMLSKMSAILHTDVQWVTNWAALFAQKTSSTPEIVIVGPESDLLRKDLDRFFIPNKITAGTSTISQLPLLLNRTTIADKTAIYICYNKTCQLPVTNVKDALALLQQ